jgi:hypothetical protein
MGTDSSEVIGHSKMQKRYWTEAEVSEQLQSQSAPAISQASSAFPCPLATR